MYDVNLFGVMRMVNEFAPLVIVSRTERSFKIDY